MKIFLDMDGVLVDFLGGAARVHGRPLPYSDPQWLGEWNTEKGWGITAEEFWAPINADPNFWSSLQQTPEADRIVQLAIDTVGLKNVAILTSPDRNGYCFTGKIQWMLANYPMLEPRMIFGRAKEFMASPERILIDDKDGNVEAFRKAGGHAVLVPRLWNSDYDNADQTSYCVALDLFNLIPVQESN